MFNITNYFEHPTRPGYYIFKFYDKERADYFEELLNKESIWFESSIDEEDKITYLYGIKVSDYQNVLNLNYLVSAKFRKKTISSSYIRIIIYIITIGIITLAIVGALKSES